ncbi:alpha/beta fold hydrolase [Spongiivirga citrea]|uniref:Alpha/beta fold hydrolase n=1 Tax=Spongiivirga citrea TaxID=1481457 RepID=A0A6M0CLK9_9FLAO|nr:alpha/beta fold hydrolase [Spongiivirga citrea]NER18826.1 alpha/beta fold hydrolase [Spongiivirga citrea]
MKNELQHIKITNFQTESGAVYNTIPLSYQVFGPTLGSAPVVLVNHALTGNSEVIGEQGWWNELIGYDKLIDTTVYTVLAFNIPGNGFDGFLVENYKNFKARDVAQIFNLGLKQLKINSLFACIGGSVGGGIAWELAALNPILIENLIPIASDWKSSDWMLANTLLQDLILNNSSNPVHDARIQAMLCYRTPDSFKGRFNRTINNELGIFNIESWLLHHGKKLKDRFQLASYKLLNQLLSSIDITRERNEFLEVASKIEANIHLVGVDSDLFFTAQENKETVEELSTVKSNVFYYEIKSIHGHDAFLIEFGQLEKLLKNVFNKQLVSP